METPSAAQRAAADALYRKAWHFQTWMGDLMVLNRPAEGQYKSIYVSAPTLTIDPAGVVTHVAAIGV